MNKYKLLPVKPDNNMRSAASQLFARNPKANPVDYYCAMVAAAKDVTPDTSRLAEALERLVFAAHRRDNSTGDQIRLIETREELKAAAKNAEEVLVAFCKLREGSK